MANVSYTPGNHTALVGDSCWVLVDASPDAPVVAEIWRRMAGEPQRVVLSIQCWHKGTGVPTNIPIS